jgi:transposase
MPKQIQQGNNTLNHAPYQLYLPMDVGIKIEVSEKVCLLLEITERLGYNILKAAYERQPRDKEASPKQMFQLVVLGFMEGITSTRKLESACKHDIRFMYVLHGKPAPDHNRFWSFIKHRMQGDVAEHLFYQVVEYLLDRGEISLANVFIDGTKIEANANRYSFVWKKSTNKYETRLDDRIAALQSELMARYLYMPQISSADQCFEYLV